MGLQSEDKKNPKDPKYFKTPVYAGVFDVFEWLFSAGQSVPFPEMSVFVSFFIGAVFAPFKLWQILTEMETGKIALTACGSTLINKIMYTFASTFCFISWIAMVFITPSRGLWSVAWALFLAHAIFLAVIRMEVRGQLDLAGDLAQDFLLHLSFTHVFFIKFMMNSLNDTSTSIRIFIILSNQNKESKSTSLSIPS